MAGFNEKGSWEVAPTHNDVEIIEENCAPETGNKKTKLRYKDKEYVVTQGFMLIDRELNEDLKKEADQNRRTLGGATGDYIVTIDSHKGGIPKECIIYEHPHSLSPAAEDRYGRTHFE